MVDPLTSSGERDREVEALLILQALPGVGPARVRRVVAEVGSASRALTRPDVLRGLLGAEAAAAAASEALRGEVTRALDTARRMGMTTLVMSDGGYPHRLLRLADPPPVLFLRGTPDLLARSGVAVVGARRATARARDVARRLGAAVARTGTPVVSGLALGVDAAAHQGALEVEGPTVAVMGRGADRPYPTSHGRLFRAIVEQGLVVSEFPPGTPPLPHHFPRRNRILAALSSTLVVVEAGVRSGALITVDHALDLGLDVWAVPGPIDEAVTAGTNGLLADGARPLVSVEGFVRMALGDDPREADPLDLDPEEELLLSFLAHGPRSSDELARETRLGAPRTLALLAGLELRGGVLRLPGMRFRKAG